MLQHTKNIQRLSLASSILSWAGLMVVDLILIFSKVNEIEYGGLETTSKLLLNLWFISLFVYYQYQVNRAENINFIDLLWRVFATGLIATLVAFSIRFLFYVLSNHDFVKNILTINFFYHINLGVISAFLISTFVVYKRLILYQKARNLYRIWQVFQYSLLVAVFLNFIALPVLSTPYLITLAVLILLGLFLSANLKWVAYLNFKQKWKSILLLLLIIIYVYYFFIYLFTASEGGVLQTNLYENIFITALFAFIVLYTLFSLLVILFNLPTSSVFEQKLEDVLNFQRLSQSVQAGETEEQVFDILMNSSISAVLADAAWIEASMDDKPFLIKHQIKGETIKKVQKFIEESKSRNILERGLSRKFGYSKFSASIKHEKYKSALVVPIIVKDEIIGRMVLLKDIKEGFNKEMLEIVNTFANQASISVENTRLLTDALENERYKEELKIAKRVQMALLPDKLVENDSFEMVGFTKAAAEIGGDYYDTYEIDKYTTAIVIGDVSGKGTSAAFHMSQMKGIFQSLGQLNLSPDEFLNRANTALSKCLEKTSFITLTYYIVDTKNQSVVFSRAGHCPTLYYNRNKKEATYFKNKGLGLGIIRNSEYNKYVEVNNFNYSSGDIMLLYTDGIVEAQNEKKEEFGYERLQSLLLTYNELNLDDLQNKIIEKLYEFCESTILNDDYTIVLVRFK